MTTTLVGARRSLEVISMSNNPARRSGKRLIAAADFEQDGDFQFTRNSKREKVKEPEPVKEVEGVGSRTSAGPRATGGSAINGSIPEEKDMRTNETIAAAKPATRKSTRRKASADVSNEESSLEIVEGRSRRNVRVSGERLEEAAPAPGLVAVAQTNGARHKRGGRAKAPPRGSPEPNQSQQNEPSVQSSTVALAMSDTPVINRNKEIRKKGNTNRRSSLGMRGRRASSLIESGQAAIPHREVNPAEFYKHIEAEGLTEPRRMKQLLIWCSERSLTEKPPRGTPGSNAILGARAIQDQLRKYFSSRSELSDWFSREDEMSKAPVVLRANPRNMELDEKRVQLEMNVKRLQEEKKAWQAIRKPLLDVPPLFPKGENGPVALPDFDFLDPDEGKIRGLLTDEAASFNAVRTKTESRLGTIQSLLEFQIDQLADAVHKLEQRVFLAGKEADKVLSISALRLRQREEKEKTAAGTRDMPVMEVLHGLGSILPKRGG
ncbi:hypothetical protein NCS52_01569000 [Fusarium sp. LHS14.1]|nr:hypothetical protein NCS52_01569000 [Fusarium sp. LHS14.1]